MPPKTAKRTTPARAVTPRRAITPRRETRQTTPKTPRNPAPSLSASPVRPPLPPLPPIIATSSSLLPTAQRDNPCQWLEQHAPVDPVFASFDTTRAAENIIGHTIQSLDHCGSLYYPDIAEGYGMTRWAPANLPRMGSRGSTCYVEGTTQTSCHKRAVPAFMYTHHSFSKDTCPFAEREGFPPLICRYKIDKAGHLHFGACWACSTRGYSPCPIIQLPPLMASTVELSNEALARQTQLSSRRSKPRGRSASVASLDDRSGVKRAARQQTIQDVVLQGALSAGTDDHLAPVRSSIPPVQHRRSHEVGLTITAAGDRSADLDSILQPPNIDVHSPIYENPSPPPTRDDIEFSVPEARLGGVDNSASDGHSLRPWAVYMKSRARSRTPSQPTMSINLADHLPPGPSIRTMGETPSDVSHIQAGTSLAPPILSAVPSQKHVVKPAESERHVSEAPDHIPAAEISFDKDAHRASLSALLSLPLAAAKRYCSEMEHFQDNSHEAFEALFAKVDEIERSARSDRAAIDAVRAERDKVSRTNRGLDTKIAVISKEAKDHEAEITRLTGMIKYYEVKLEESQSERRTSDERMTEATVERDEAIDASANADRARLQAEAERDDARRQRDEAVRQRAETDDAMDDMMTNMVELESRIEEQDRFIAELQAEKHRLEDEVTSLRPSQPVHHSISAPNSAANTDTGILHASPTTVQALGQVSTPHEEEKSQSIHDEDAPDKELGVQAEGEDEELM